MKITTFNPQIVTTDLEPIVKLFEELGFEKRHDQEGVGALNVEVIRMKDAEGFHLDVSQPEMELPQDMVAIRMNVDDYEEARNILLQHGFKNIYGARTVDTSSSKSAFMISPSGFAINLVKHHRK